MPTRKPLPPIPNTKSLKRKAKRLAKKAMNKEINSVANTQPRRRKRVKRPKNQNGSLVESITGNPTFSKLIQAGKKAINWSKPLIELGSEFLTTISVLAADNHAQMFGTPPIGKFKFVPHSRGNRWIGTSHPTAYIKDGLSYILSSPAAGDIVYTTDVSPDQIGSSRLQKLGDLYQRYVFKRFVVEYTPAANTTLTGQLMAYFDTNPDTIPPAGMDGIRYGEAHGGKPWQISQPRTFTMPILIDKAFYTHLDPGDTEEKLHLQAVFYVVAMTSLPISAIGTFRIRYSCEFDLATMSDARSLDTYGYDKIAAGPYTFAPTTLTPFRVWNSTRQILSSNSSILVGSAGNGTIISSTSDQNNGIQFRSGSYDINIILDLGAANSWTLSTTPSMDVLFSQGDFTLCSINGTRYTSVSGGSLVCIAVSVNLVAHVASPQQTWIFNPELVSTTSDSKIYSTETVAVRWGDTQPQAFQGSFINNRLDELEKKLESFGFTHIEAEYDSKKGKEKVRR